MALTDTAIRNAKPADKPRKLADEKGLYLLINQACKYWRFDYRFNNKRKTLAIGVYPDTTLALAREKRDAARTLLANDVDPSENRKAQKAALRRLDYGSDELTGHGFRSMASTLLNEQGWHRDAIERQLAHGERNSVRAAYNYAEHLPERRRMMQAWADFLDALAASAEVIPMKSRAEIG